MYQFWEKSIQKILEFPKKKRPGGVSILQICVQLSSWHTSDLWKKFPSDFFFLEKRPFYDRLANKVNLVH